MNIIITVGGFNDAPGFIIVSDGHGGFKIVKTPGWNPEVALEVNAGIAILREAQGLKSVRVQAKLVQMATEILEPHQAELNEYLTKAANAKAA